MPSWRILDQFVVAAWLEGSDADREVVTWHFCSRTVVDLAGGFGIIRDRINSSELSGLSSRFRVT